MAVRHQIVTFPVLNGMHPFPLVFNVGKGYYWRSEEQGALLGMSNPVDEADTSGRYQISFDWDYYEKMVPTGSRPIRRWRGTRFEGVGRIHRLYAGPPPDHRPAQGRVLRVGRGWARHDVGTGAWRGDGAFDLEGTLGDLPRKT